MPTSTSTRRSTPTRSTPPTPSPRRSSSTTARARSPPPTGTRRHASPSIGPAAPPCAEPCTTACVRGTRLLHQRPHLADRLASTTVGAQTDGVGRRHRPDPAHRRRRRPTLARPSRPGSTPGSRSPRTLPTRSASRTPSRSPCRRTRGRARFVPAAGQHVDVTLTDSLGAAHSAPTGTCTGRGRQHQRGRASARSASARASAGHGDRLTPRAPCRSAGSGAIHGQRPTAPAAAAVTRPRSFVRTRTSRSTRRRRQTPSVPPMS